VLVEAVFSWPGTWYLLNLAIFQRDIPVLQGVILVLSAFFVLVNLAVDPPSGCRFRTRCAFVMPRCAEAIPPPVAVGDAHHVACYLFEGEPAPVAA
jgi:ABC-type dipeptide/oligopeptide/nickel transport system ATPase component